VRNLTLCLIWALDPLTFPFESTTSSMPRLVPSGCPQPSKGEYRSQRRRVSRLPSPLLPVCSPLPLQGEDGQLLRARPQHEEQRRSHEARPHNQGGEQVALLGLGGGGLCTSASTRPSPVRTIGYRSAGERGWRRPGCSWRSAIRC
jgi:hypothetical protein